MNSRTSGSATDTPYYPLFLNIKDKPCVVIGGGAVAQRKVFMLLKFHAKVRVISPRVTKPLERLKTLDRIEIAGREYAHGDLSGCSLVFAATDNEDINRMVFEEGRQRGIPVNVADNPALCDFFVPSIVKRGSTVIAISTSGTLPFFAKKLRKELDLYLGPEYRRFATIVSAFRKHLIAQVKDKRVRKAVMNKIAGMSIPEVNALGFAGLKERFLR